MKYKLSDGADDFMNWFQANMKGMDDATREVTADVGELGAEFMRERILTAGTAWTRAQGRDGRLDKGDMFDGVKVRRAGNQNYTKVSFGWIGGDPHYARFQDEGFVQHGTGKTVQGMYALSDAYDYVEVMWRQYMEKRLSAL